MPTCTNQSGYNNAKSNLDLKLAAFAQLIQAHVNWEIQSGQQYPGTSAGNCTIAEASEFAWWCAYYMCGRPATQGETELWGGQIYDGVKTPQQVATAWQTCPECYTLFGCS